MAREADQEWGEPGYGDWAEGALRPVREQTREHPWLGVAAAFTAGALLGALTRQEEEIRIRLARNERLVIHPRPVEMVEDEDEEEVEEEMESESRLGRLARRAGEPWRRFREEEPEEEESPLERMRSAVWSGVEGLAERLPHRRPRSRMDRLRDALAEALPGSRPPTLSDRVRRAFE